MTSSIYSNALLRLSTMLLSLSILVACGGGSSGGSDAGGGGGGGAVSNFTVSTSTDTGVSLSPSSATVPQGQTAAFNVQLASGFQLNTIDGCGGTLNQGVYTTGPINAACTVTASSRLSELSIRSTINAEAGTIGPSTNVIQSGETAQFTVELNPFYSISEVTGCATEEPEEVDDRKYRIVTKQLFSECTVSVQADLPGEDVFFAATVEIIGNGTVDATRKEVNFLQTISFAFTPDEGNELVDVVGCGGVFDGLEYTTAPMTEDCTIQARFLSDELVFFPDPQLQSAVRSALNIAPGTEVSREALQTLLDLNINGAGVANLRGLEHAVNLQILRANNNPQITDLTPLWELPLQVALLERVGASSISALLDSPVRILHLDNSQISNLHGIEKLSDLSDLRIAQTDISDMAGLASLAALDILDFRSTRIQDMRPLLESGLGTAGVAFGGGCVAQTQRISRAVVDELRARGVNAQIPLSILRDDCPTTTAPIVDAQMQFSATGDIEAQWQIRNVISPEDLQCELHINLQRQTARVPHRLVESCALDGSETLQTGLQYARITLVVDDGINLPVRVNTPIVANPHNEATVALANVDWGQSVLKRNPLLVRDRAALFRVQLVSETGATPPPVSLAISSPNGSEVIQMNAPTELPQSPNYTSFSSSYHAQIPAQFMRDGLAVEVRSGGEVLYRTEPTFAERTPLYLTVVPMVIDGKSPNMPTEAWIKERLTEHWPLSDIQVRFRAPYTVPSNIEIESLRDLLIVLRDLRTAEGGQEHYHGFFDPDAIEESRFSGIAFMPGRAGVTWDRLNSDTFSHEMGHNFSVGHIDCGSPTGVELAFPYNPGTIGSVGVPQTNDGLIAPENRRDIMSYCGPKHVSDWVFEKAQDYQLANPSLPFAEAGVSSLAQDLSILALGSSVIEINGVIEPLGRTRIVSINTIPAHAITFGSSLYTLEITDSRGALHYASVALMADSHSQGQQGGIFSAFTEVQDIAHVRILRGDTELLSQTMNSITH